MTPSAKQSSKNPPRNKENSDREINLINKKSNSSTRSIMTRSKQENSSNTEAFGECKVAGKVRKENQSICRKSELETLENDHSSQATDISSFPSKKSVSYEIEGVCPICKAQFDNRHVFTRHLRNSHSKDNTCGICDSKLSSPSSLDRHMLTHSGEKPHVCCICNRCFSTNGNLHRHMNTHDEKDLVKKRTVSNSGGPNKKLKMDDAPDVIVPPPKEDIIPTVENKIDNASKRLCPEIVPSNSFPSCAVGTKRGYLRLSKIPFSMKKFELIARTTCKDNNKRSKKQFAAESEDGTHKCIPCGCYFGSNEDEEVHRYKHHQSQSAKSVTIQCTVDYFCAKLGLMKKPIEENPVEVKHSAEPTPACDARTIALDTDFGELQIDLSVDESSDDGRSSCRDVAVEDNIDMRKSINGTMFNKDTDSTDTVFVTNDIDESQSCIALNLSTSVAPSHNHVESGHDFADIKSILSNLAVTPVTPPTRTYSDKSAFSSTDQDLSSDEESKMSDTSDQKDDVKDIKRSKSKKISNKPHHVCPEPGCNYWSIDKSSVSRHVRSHTKEQPFMCTVCGKLFTTKANTERHVGKVHRLSKDRFPSVVVYNVVATQSSDNESICRHCDRDFKYSRLLQHHIRSNRSCSQKPYVCNICKVGCSTKNNLKRHLAKQHPESKQSEEDMQCQEDTLPSSTPTKSEQELSFDFKTQSDSTCSSIAAASSSSPEKNNSPDEDDRVNAAEGLVCLSEGNFPLDLRVRALDLSGNRSFCEMSMGKIVKRVSNNPSSSHMMSRQHSPSRSPTVRATAQIYASTPLDLSRRSSTPHTSALDSVAASVSSLSSSPLQASYNHFNFSLDRLSPENLTSVPAENKKPKNFTCEYCGTGFTLKTNRDRHIKRKHPEKLKRKPAARPFQNVPKSASPKILNETKKALLTRVLKNTDDNQQYLEMSENRHSLYDSRMPAGNRPEVDTGSDLENVDLASVTSVINTANCQSISQYLIADINSNTVLSIKGKEGSTTINPQAIFDHYNNLNLCKRPNTDSLHPNVRMDELHATEPSARVEDSTSKSVVTDSAGNEARSKTRTSDPAQFECNLCKNTFSSERELSSHLKELHHSTSAQVINAMDVLSFWKKENKHFGNPSLRVQCQS